MNFLWQWIRNLFTHLLIFAAVCIGMLIFMWIFYPDALSFLKLTGEFSVGLVNMLKLWPLIILMVIVSALPRRRRR